MNKPDLFHTPEGTTRLYRHRGQLLAYNLTPRVALALAQLGFPLPEPLALPARPRRLGLTDLPARYQGALELSQPCRLCARRCLADRTRGEGWCRAPLEPERLEVVLHAGEEVGPTLCLYLGGCSMACGFCTSYDLVRHPWGPKRLSSGEVAGQLEEWRKRGAASFTVIGGEPSLYLPWVLEVASQNTTLPLVWNSNALYTEEVAELLAGVVDAYVLDLKFGNNRCALRLSKTPAYLETVWPNIRRAAHDQGALLVVRHVLMPGHLECCAKPVLEGLVGLPGAVVNLMSFIPEYRSRQLSLGRFTEPEELRAARDYARELGLRVWELGD